MAYAKYTEVPVTKTRGEIERLLETAKAKSYGTAVDYDTLTARVQFRLQERIIRFTVSLPDQRKLGPTRFQRAERQRWRALLLVLKAKLESVESGIETFDSAFLAQIVMPGDATVGDLLKPHLVDAYRTGKMPLLLTGKPEEEVEP